MDDFLGGVFAHIVIALVGGWAGFLVKANLLWFTKLLDPIAKKQAKLLHGSWTANEAFSDDKSHATYKLELVCRGAQVTGTQSYMSGRPDKNATFDLTGSFENSVVTFTWTKTNSLETGAGTLKLVADGKLEGHGLYVANQKVYTSVFTATKD